MQIQHNSNYKTQHVFFMFVDKVILNWTVNGGAWIEFQKQRNSENTKFNTSLELERCLSG